MTVRDSVDDVVRKLQGLDRAQLLCGLPKLADADVTWVERTRELQARVNLLGADGPSQDVLDALGAHVVAFKQALAAAEETRVESGEAA